MPDRRASLVPLFLAAQALLIHWAAGGERMPAVPDLSGFPAEIAAWKRIAEDPASAQLAGLLKADAFLSSTWIRASTGATGELLMAWYRSQQGGTVQPHSPGICLPGNGWIIGSAREMTIDTTAGPIAVNQWIVTKGGARAVVLYWYQTARRVVASEWEAKVWLAADVLRDRRTDEALVRVTARVANGEDDVAIAAAADFARGVYPVLRERLPK